MDRFEDAKLRVKEATDLVALIESYLPLRPSGRYLKALCPFHKENSPSFTVYRAEQYFKCYGCGKTGDVFDWLKERDGLNFREAMEQLADRAGISLEGVFRGGAQASAVKGPDPYEALAAVSGFFQRALLAPEAGRLGREYLTKRGLAEAIAPWRLGVHPAPGALSRFAQEQQLPLDVLEAAGLLRNGREQFAHRVMFPIEDERGRIVGFGGRILPGAPGSEGQGDYTPPKYLNSPESPFFLKRRVLFGLHAAKKAGQRRIVVMEGYTDVIACHLAGFQGAVASLGTAFTADHARTLERYATAGLVLMFDGDRAGQQAAERAMRELVNSRLPVRIALMSDADGGAKDPADIVVARDGEDPELVAERRMRFADVLDGAEPALTVWFRLLRRRLDLSQSVHVETAAHDCAGLLALVTEPVRQAAMLQEMARHLAIPAPTLERLLKKRPEPQRSAAAAGDDRVGGDAAPLPAIKLTPLQQSEADLLACVLAQPGLLTQLDLERGGPQSTDIVVLLRWAADGVALDRRDREPLFRYLFTRAAEQSVLQALLATANERAVKLAEPEAVFAGLLAGRRRLIGVPQVRQLRQELQDAIAMGDHARAGQLQASLQQLLRQDRPRSQDDGLPSPPSRPLPPSFLPGQPRLAANEPSLPPDSS